MVVAAVIVPTVVVISVVVPTVIIVIIIWFRKASDSEGKLVIAIMI